jgi:hypothetical protein
MSQTLSCFNIFDKCRNGVKKFFIFMNIKNPEVATASLHVSDSLASLAAFAALGNKVKTGGLPKCVAMPKVGEARRREFNSNFVTGENLRLR